jgi:hypothetical protein
MSKKIEVFLDKKCGEIMERHVVDVSVKAEDILNGEIEETTSCAIALAIRRTLPAAADVHVCGPGDIEVNDFEHDVSVDKEANSRIRQFIRKFDKLNGEPGSDERRLAMQKSSIAPFKFRLGLIRSTGVSPSEL